MTEQVLYNRTRLAWHQAKLTGDQYTWASNDYHLHARTRNYQQDWVPAVAYQVAQKFKAFWDANQAFQKHKAAYETTYCKRWEPPPGQ